MPKAKLEVDYREVARVTGMRERSAANKFRGVMKQFEDEGATWTKADAPEKAKTEKPVPKRKTAKKAAPKFEAKFEDDDNAEEENPPAKKAKTAPKKRDTATAKGKKKTKTTKAVTSGDEEAKDDEDTSDGGEDEGT